MDNTRILTTLTSLEHAGMISWEDLVRLTAGSASNKTFGSCTTDDRV